MGAALESLTMILLYSGLAAVITAALVGYWRLRTEPNTRNIIQRFPLLLPAIAFLVMSNLVVSFLPVPIADYTGVNVRPINSSSDFNVTFTVREPGVAYQSAITISASDFMEPGEHFSIVVQMYRDEILNTTESMDLNAGVIEDIVSTSTSVNADPGTYRLVVNSTFYIGPTPQPDQPLNFEISQRLRSGFTEELRDWSTYQLALNLIVIVLVVAGFCINQTPVFRPRYGRPLYPEGREPEKTD
jgi:hypothetical protein